MSDKVKLPREVAEAIACMKAKGLPLNEIVERHVNRDHIEVNDFEKVAMLSTDTLIRALYIGYEVEKTPEDKVREYYLRQKALVVNEHEFDKPTTAIRYVLECLGIKIDGVW